MNDDITLTLTRAEALELLEAIGCACDEGQASLVASDVGARLIDAAGLKRDDYWWTSDGG